MEDQDKKVISKGQMKGRRFNLNKRSVGNTSPPEVNENYNVICVKMHRKDQLSKQLHHELDDIESDLQTIEPWTPRKQHLMRLLSYYILYEAKDKKFKNRRVNDVADRALRIFFTHSDERSVYLNYKNIYSEQEPVKKMYKCMKAVGKSIMDISK